MPQPARINRDWSATVRGDASLDIEVSDNPTDAFARALHRSGLLRLEIGLAAFLGLSALAGGVSVLYLPTAMLDGGPFSSFAFPAIALFAIGLLAASGAVLLVRRNHWGIFLAIAAGVGIVIFEAVEVWVISLGSWLSLLGIQPTFDLPPAARAPFSSSLWLQPLYAAVGLALIITGAYLVPAPAPRVRGSWMPPSLVALAAGITAAVVFGPIGLGAIQWRVSADLLHQIIGADAAMLLLVVPSALAAAWLWRLDARLATPLALGVGLVTLYYAVADVVGADYTRYSGNNERVFLLFLGLIVLSWMTAARAWAALDMVPPVPDLLLARGFAAVLLAAGGLLLVAWLGQLIPIALTGTVPPEYLESPNAFWIVRIVDLGFIVPASLWTAIGLWRGRPAAHRAAYGLVAFMTLQGAEVLAIGGVMLASSDPAASLPFVIVLAPIVVACAAFTALLFRSYAEGRGHGARLVLQFEAR
jgi:hypothetical protein